MKNLVITSSRTFNEDSCIRIKGNVQIANVKCKFVLETSDRYGIDIEGISEDMLPELIVAILEVDPDLDCYLED